jgi:hypothetical protein
MPPEVDSSDTEREYVLLWRTASSSGATDCVQVARTGEGVAVRDSKNPAGAVHAYGRATWRAFLAQIKTGAFDHSSG